MKCSHCGNTLSPDSKFCRHCGEEIFFFCTNCGLQLEKDAKFCAGCGTKVKKTNTEEEKKTDILPTIGEMAVDVAGTVLEKMEEINHSTHSEEVRNAQSAQVETSARSQMPAKPQASTHTDGSAGGAGQKIRRDSVSVRDAAERQAQSVSDEVPVEALQTPEVAVEPAQASQTAAPAPQNMPAYEPAPVQTQVPPQAPVGTAVRPPVSEPIQHAAPVTKEVVEKMTDTTAELIKEGAKKLSVGKTVAIWAAVVTFVIGAAAACLNFFVPAPEDTVDKLIVSVEELKYDDMLSCFDSTTEKQIRAVMGITGDLFGSLTGISIDLEDLMAFAPSMDSYLDIPDLGIASAETVLYADCSKSKLMTYCETANSGGSIPTGYLSDNEIVNFLMEYNISLPGLENLIAEVAVVKITLKSGEVGYLPLINEGWGDWRIPVMDMINEEGLG